jgi:hypothetical protein
VHGTIIRGWRLNVSLIAVSNCRARLGDNPPTGVDVSTPLCRLMGIVRPVTNTVAPASPRPIAIPRPMPRLAPLTSATWPFKGPPIV